MWRHQSTFRYLPTSQSKILNFEEFRWCSITGRLILQSLLIVDLNFEKLLSFLTFSPWCNIPFYQRLQSFLHIFVSWAGFCQKSLWTKNLIARIESNWYLRYAWSSDAISVLQNIGLSVLEIHLVATSLNGAIIGFCYRKWTLPLSFIFVHFLLILYNESQQIVCFTENVLIKGSCLEKLSISAICQWSFCYIRILFHIDIRKLVVFLLERIFLFLFFVALLVSFKTIVFKLYTSRKLLKLPPLWFNI